MKTEVALKVDVDTHAGARDGIPRLMDLLRETGIRASFFVSMGPDNSGRALRRIFRPGFLRKMVRTRALAAYGWRTALRGVLLPAPLIGSRFPDLLRRLEEEGHEVGPHGWDHVHWHDRARTMDEGAARSELERSFRAAESILGHPPEGSAAPGWQCTPHSLRIQDDLGLVYHSDTRGERPYIPCIEGKPLAAIEIPTTLPTLDEVLGTPAARREGLVETFERRLRAGELNVFTLHAEFEGRRHLDFFASLIRRWLERGAGFVRLIDAARNLRQAGAEIPRAEVIWAAVPGRAGELSCQAPGPPSLAGAQDLADGLHHAGDVHRAQVREEG